MNEIDADSSLILVYFIIGFQWNLEWSMILINQNKKIMPKLFLQHEFVVKDNFTEFIFGLTYTREMTNYN